MMNVDTLLFEELDAANHEYTLGVTTAALRLLAGGLLPNITGPESIRAANTSFYAYESWLNVVRDTGGDLLLSHLRGSLHTITFARHARRVRMCGLSYFMAHMRRAAALLADRGSDEGYWDIAALTPNVTFLSMILVPSNDPLFDYWLASELPAQAPDLRFAFERLYGLDPQSHATMVANESGRLS